MTSEPCIQIVQLQKVSNVTIALDFESFTVFSKEIAVLIGPTGSGKALLFSLLTGQTAPSSGTIRVCGLDPRRNHRQVSSKIGVLFLKNTLYDRLTAKENLAFHCRMHGMPPTLASLVLEEVGLSDQAGIPAGKLAPNMARRLAFGRAILHKPQVLLLFEPFSNCDAGSISLLSRIITEKACEGAAILILSQNWADLAVLCTSAYSLERGRPILMEMNKAERSVEMPFKIPVRQEGQVALLNPADILFATAEDDYTCLYTIRGKVPSQFSLSELEKRLSRNGFFRAHRSYLVNLQRVKVIIPYTRDSFTLILDDEEETEIPLSKAAARELRGMLGY